MASQPSHRLKIRCPELRQVLSPTAQQVGNLALSTRQFVQGTAIMIEGDPPAAHPFGIDLVSRCPIPYCRIITRRYVREVDIDTTDFIDPLQQLCSSAHHRPDTRDGRRTTGDRWIETRLVSSVFPGNRSISISGSFGYRRLPAAS